MVKALFLAAALGFVAPASAEPIQKLAGTWQYRWGDFPTPATGQAAPADGWRPLLALHTPPGQSPDHIVWLRIPLPAGEWADPALLLSSVAGAFEAYAGNRLIGSGGVIRPQGTESVGPPSWLLLGLTRSDTGHEVLLRIQSSATVVGIERGAYIGSRADLLGQIVSDGLGSFVVGLLLMFTGLISLAAWASERRDRSLLALTSFSMLSAGLIFGFSDMTPLVLPWRVAIARMESVTLDFFCAAFVWTITTSLPNLASPRTARVIRGLAVFGVFTSLMAVLGLPGNRQVANLVLVVVLAVVGVGVFGCFEAALGGDADARLLALGFSVLFLAGGKDALPVFGIGDSSTLITEWGFLAVVLSFAAVAARRARRVTQTLASRTLHLEDRRNEVQAFSRRLETSAQHLGTVVDALRRASDAQTAGATRQASSVRETQVTAEEIKRTSTLAAEKAQRMMEAAVEADAAGKTGEAAVNQSLHVLEEIGTEVTSMTRQISAAGTQASEIAGIVSTVKDLATQSNMLALNAAIEAMRSGEAGRSFSVVALEMRRLADESLRATARIKEVLDGLSHAIGGAVTISQAGEQRVAQGLAQMRASGDQLQRLTGIVQLTSGHVRQISSAVNQQNAGVAQIVSAIDDLSDQMQSMLDRALDGEAIAARVQAVVASMQTGDEIPASDAGRAA